MSASPSRYRPIIESRTATPDERRNVTKWMLGFAAFLALSLGLASLQMFQVSSEGAGKGALTRATAALTELDALLDRHYDDLQVEAEAAVASDMLELEDYPIALDLSKDDVLGRSPDALRAVILDRSTDRLYEDGPEVLRESAEDQGGLGRFSIAGITDGMLGQLTAGNHARFGIATILLLGIAAALCIATSSACRGAGRLTALGLVLAAAGAVILAGGLLVMAYANVQSEGDEYVRSEFFGVIGDLAAVPMRNGLMCLAAGAGLVVIAMAAGPLTRGRSMEAGPLSR